MKALEPDDIHGEMLKLIENEQLTSMTTFSNKIYDIRLIRSLYADQKARVLRTRILYRSYSKKHCRMQLTVYVLTAKLSIISKTQMTQYCRLIVTKAYK